MARLKPNPDPDPRHKPFVDFAFETYREKRGETLVITPRDIGAVRDMLKATRPHEEEYSIEKLQQAWMCFLEKATPFDRTQAPLKHFAMNLNHWAHLCNGNGNSHRPGTETAKNWVQDRIRKLREV